ncbi:unnamed protein product [Larinioides sclopetarius]|uniref:Ankyrin repeat protein n=1 Tax=Larinioides sclopetarius TaxID=280406 RepID=A0AAV2A891_9ARAC
MDFLAAYHPNWYIFNDSNLAFIQEFLVREGNPNKPYYSGVTIFHDAINIPSDNIRVVRELINAGADVNLRTHLDLTPLHLAVSQRKQQVVKALIQSGASVNAKDFLGRTSLHFAVTPLIFRGPHMKLRIPPDPTIINNLLQHKDIDCNAMDSNGETALMMAVKDQEMSAALQLFRNEANPNICNNDFETPLHAAFSLSPSYIEIQLLLSGANIYSVDKNGQTPLDILLKNGQTYHFLVHCMQYYNENDYVQQKGKLEMYA